MAAVRHLSAVPDPEPVRVYEALLDLLAEYKEASARFESVCRRYTIFPDGEVLVFRAVLVRHGQHCRYEDVEAALYALALEELPKSWAAGRERLRLRVRDRDAGGGAPKAATAVEDLVAAETVWLRELWLLAEDPPSYLRLREVSSRVWAELRRHGRNFDPEHFSEHVHEVVRAVFPHAPGAAWDTAWADVLAKRAIAYVGKRIPTRSGGTASAELDRAHDEVVAAAEAEDRRRYRRALREWVAATLDASSPSV